MPGGPAGGRDGSGGGSDCHECRCLERDEYREDLQEKERYQILQYIGKSYSTTHN